MCETRGVRKKTAYRGKGPKNQLGGEGLDLQHPDPPTFLNGTALTTYRLFLH